jgi:hypothetical protein
MSPAEFIRHSRVKTLYHFTDVRNISSIKKHGLLSWRELRSRGIAPIAPGGNDLSHELDESLDLDLYVHLCFWAEHPMEWVARNEGRIGKAVFLRISTAILNYPGVQLTAGVANKTGVERLDFAAASKTLDFEPIHSYLDWREPENRSRAQATRKYEVLVPNIVPVQFISGWP